VLRFAVVGNPVSHSKSPLIHSLFASQTGKQLQYTREQVALDGFEGFVRQFFESGGAGLNVTVPFKEQAFELAEQHSDRALLARAVNTLYLDDHKRLCGDNTDGVGLVRDLRDNSGVAIAGKRLLIIGAGGAVRGALGSLADEAPESITLINRTLSRAITLQQEFSELAQIRVLSFEHDFEESFDLVINGTSTGLQGEAPPISPAAVGPLTCCYDMMYGSQDTPFMSWARQLGASLVLDGLGMLVEQAAESFSIWLDETPETASVIKQVRASLS
jgi:shikimate dehydrogenase